MLEGTSPVCGLFVDLGRSSVDRWVMCWRRPACGLFVDLGRSCVDRWVMCWRGPHLCVDCLWIWEEAV